MQCPNCGFYDVFTPFCPKCNHINETNNQKSSNSQISIESTSLPLVISETSEPKIDINNEIKIQDNIIRNSDGSFILNPNGIIPLNIYNVQYENILEIKKCIDTVSIIGTKEAGNNLIPLIIKSNLKCKQIDEFIFKYKDDYLNGIELPIMPFNWPKMIFTYQPEKFKEINKLIEIYDYKNLYFYVKHAGGPLKIKRLKKSQRDYKKYLELCSIGLAQNGEKIPFKEILEFISLKELKEIPYFKNKLELNSKKKITDFLLNNSNSSEIIKKFISLDEFFKILPFDAEHKLTNIEISSAIDYSLEIAEIICHTFFHGNNQVWNNIKDDKSVIGIRIFGINDGRLCPLCKKISSLEYYTKDKRIMPPFHIGCRCAVIPIFLTEKNISELYDYNDFLEVKTSIADDFRMSIISKD